MPGGKLSPNTRLFNNPYGYYVNNNPVKYVDPMGFWSIWVQKYDDGNTYLSVEFDDMKILSTMKAAVNALPFGSAFDYAGRIEDLAGVITSATDGFGGLESMYKYKPDNELLERIKKWDTIAPTVNDILDKTKVYESIAEKLTSNAAKNIVKNAAEGI